MRAPCRGLLVSWRRSGVAIYHLSAKVIGRSSGRSSVAAAAYRSGERLVDERTGLIHDYTRRRGEIECWIQAPEQAAKWARNREELWNRVEASEKRRDSQLCREVEVALPKELSREEQGDLVRHFVQEQFVSRGMVADVAIHRGDENNPHAHVLLTTREVSSEGFGKKVREWNGREVLEGWREAWAERTNRELERVGSLERIDHRSFASRGIDREPSVHEGPSVRQMEARGIATERSSLNRAARELNRQRELGRERGWERSGPEIER
jgi:ATP-dependent exoDNAse (exonuclease V) alpha subunit